MAENGKKAVTFGLSMLGGFIGVALAINTLVFVPLNAGLAQECTKREIADAAIMKNVDDKLDKILKITIDTNVTLAGIGKQVDVNTKRLEKMDVR